VTGIREPDMLTGMTKRDWTIVLDVFDAAQSSRGEPGHDDRRFLEAIHLKTDLDGNPLDFHLTGGEASDSTQFVTSLDIGSDIRLKRFERVAMRCEKTHISTSAIISFACGLMLVKSVHRA